jgi:hypothetical protein
MRVFRSICASFYTAVGAVARSDNATRELLGALTRCATSPGRPGATLWGYRFGMWSSAQGAILAHDNGAERPAFRRLLDYVRNNSAPERTGQLDRIDGNSIAGRVLFVRHGVESIGADRLGGRDPGARSRR